MPLTTLLLAAVQQAAPASPSTEAFTAVMQASPAPTVAAAGIEGGAATLALVPEPLTMGLLGLGIGAVAIVQLRQQLRRHGARR